MGHRDKKGVNPYTIRKLAQAILGTALQVRGPRLYLTYGGMPCE
jgi:hypothetical protein